MKLEVGPEIEELIEEYLKQGAYATPEEVVLAGLISLKANDESADEDSDEMDEETIAAIEESEAQFDRGEGRPFREVAEELRRKYLGG